MITPRWLRTQVQPIAVRDVLHYLTNAAELPAEVSRAFDIGGPDTFTYTNMIRRYAAIAGLRRRIAIPVPVLTPWLSSHWVNLITPLPRILASSLMDSLENDVVCGEHDIAAHIPDPKGGLTDYEEAVELALAWVGDGELQTRWWRDGDDDSPARPLPTDPPWAGGSLHEQVWEQHLDADTETLWQVFESIGAEHGWWRVERIDRPHLLRLRADVRLPGRLWLELSVRDDDGGRCRYRQRALFQPYGLAGEAFWKTSGLFRRAVLGGIARDITRRCALGNGARHRRGRLATTGTRQGA
jgi:hypothetical protein